MEYRDPEDLVVTEAKIDDGPMFKRIMPRARGTAYMILRRMCHIHVAIGEEEVAETAATPAPAPVVTTPAATSGGFDWLDAGAGSLVAIWLLALGGGAAAL